MKTTDFKYYLQKLKERFVKQGYNKNPIDQQFSKVKTIGRNEVLKDKTHDKETKNKTLLVLTYKHYNESTGTYLTLAEHFRGHSKKNRLRLLKEIGIRLKFDC